MDITVRRLQTRDLFALARIIRDCTAEARQRLLASVASTDGDGDVTFDRETFVLALFEAAVDQEQAFYGLLADLAGMTPEALASAPLEVPLTILETVAAQEDFPAFLTRLRRLVSRGSG